MNRSSVRIAAVALLVLVALPIFAQVNVTTYHNDPDRFVCGGFVFCNNIPNVR